MTRRTAFLILTAMFAALPRTSLKARIDQPADSPRAANVFVLHSNPAIDRRDLPVMHPNHHRLAGTRGAGPPHPRSRLFDTTTAHGVNGIMKACRDKPSFNDESRFTVHTAAEVLFVFQDGEEVR